MLSSPPRPEIADAAFRAWIRDLFTERDYLPARKEIDVLRATWEAGRNFERTNPSG